jgi:hypothetical protein
LYSSTSRIDHQSESKGYLTTRNSPQKSTTFSFLGRSFLVASTGAVLLVGVLSFYSLIQSSTSVLSSNLPIIYGFAYGTILAVSSGLSLIIFGLTNYFRSQGGTGPRTQTVLSRALRDGRSGRVLLISSVSYGLLFALISGTLVIRPGSSFSETYGVTVPSVVPVLCCGSAGQIPLLILYVTQQVALLIIPLNLSLLIIVSWLVGMNIVLTTFAYKTRPRTNAKWVTGMGAIVGLFTACPTCAGLFFLTSVGLSGTLTATLAVGSFQNLFILSTFPLLIGTLIVTSRKVDLQNCSVERIGKSSL